MEEAARAYLCLNMKENVANTLNASSEKESPLELAADSTVHGLPTGNASQSLAYRVMAFG